MRVCTWLRRVDLAPLGADAVVPACVGVLYETAQAEEELGEGGAGGQVNSVVEQCGTPQRGVGAVQHAVEASQALLGGVEGPQAVPPAARAAAPRLTAVVDAAEVVGAWWWWGEGWGVGSPGAEGSRLQDVLGWFGLMMVARSKDSINHLFEHLVYILHHSLQYICGKRDSNISLWYIKRGIEQVLSIHNCKVNRTSCIFARLPA